jgi:hypothetical protein
MKELEPGLLEIREGLHAVARGRGMTPGELQGRLETGWVLIGRQVLKFGSQIAIPGQPPGGLTEADIWMIHEPTVPQRVVMEAMVQVQRLGGGIDGVCRALFGVGVMQLMEHIEKLQGGGDGRAGGSQAEDQSA